MGNEQGKSGKKPRGPGRRWQKGQSGNPKGRPPLTEGLSEIMRARLLADGGAKLAAILNAIETKAAEGDVGAATLVMRRAFGEVTQKAEITQTVTNDYTPERIRELVQAARATVTALPEGWEDGLQ